MSNTLLLDVTDDYNHGEADKLIQSDSWTHIILLVRQENQHYIVPSVTLSGNTMRSTTQFKLLYVPMKSDAYSFASGYLTGTHPDEEVTILTTVTDRDTLLPLVNSVTFSARFLHCNKEETTSAEDKSSSDTDSDDDDSDDEEEVKPTTDDILMKSIMETLASDQGMRLISSVMGMGDTDNS